MNEINYELQIHDNISNYILNLSQKHKFNYLVVLRLSLTSF